MHAQTDESDVDGKPKHLAQQEGASCPFSERLMTSVILTFTATLNSAINAQTD